MAWTAPRTWVTSEVVTASVMNTHVRDNFLETGPAVHTSSTPGFIIGTSAANLLDESIPTKDFVSTSESTTSTSYTNLATAQPAVAVTTNTRAIVMLGARMWNTSGGENSYMSHGVTGDTTVSPSDNWAASSESGAANDAGVHFHVFMHQGLTGGSNTFTAKYKVTGGTGFFQLRHMLVIPL